MGAAFLWISYEGVFKGSRSNYIVSNLQGHFYVVHTSLEGIVLCFIQRLETRRDEKNQDTNRIESGGKNRFLLSSSVGQN